MYKYIGKRLLLFIPTILIISVVIFFIIQLPPGDYATSYAAAMAAEGEILTPEQIEELRAQFGLDKPWYIQYFTWMANILTKGDFGYSFEYGRAVWDVIAEYMPLTLGFWCSSTPCPCPSASTAPITSIPWVTISGPSSDLSERQRPTSCWQSLSCTSFM